MMWDDHKQGYSATVCDTSYKQQQQQQQQQINARAKLWSIKSRKLAVKGKNRLLVCSASFLCPLGPMPYPFDDKYYTEASSFPSRDIWSSDVTQKQVPAHSLPFWRETSHKSKPRKQAKKQVSKQQANMQANKQNKKTRQTSRQTNTPTIQQTSSSFVVYRPRGTQYD